MATKVSLKFEANVPPYVKIVGLSMLTDADGIVMEVGTRIRVTTSVLIYHHPEHRNIAFDLNGHEGEVVAIATSWKGRPVSANFPFVVKFTPKLKVHLTEQEMAAIE